MSSYYNNPTTTDFVEFGNRYEIETIHLDDGEDVVTVTVSPVDGSAEPEVDRWCGYEASVEAAAYVNAQIDATDPDRPSLEERLAPWGEEWQIEQAERTGLPF